MVTEVDGVTIPEKHRQVLLGVKWFAQMAGVDKATYYRWTVNPEDKRKNAAHPRMLQYSKLHEAIVISKIKQYPDLTPDELIAVCLDEVDADGNSIGYYLGSRSYVYRIMHQEDLINPNRSCGKGARHNLNKKRLKATGPNQIWVWDITYLYKDIDGEYFYLYAIMDLYSRKMIHYEVHTEQKDSIAASFLERALKKEHLGISGHLRDLVSNDIVIKDRLILHSDNGGPMKGKNMLAKLESLGITASYSRPMHSNDNAAMESSFATLKHSHAMPIPKCFSSVSEAQRWVDSFYDWYNNEHLHSGIGFITPADCHNGLGPEIMSKRNAIIAKSEIGRKTAYAMPDEVSIMTFTSRRKATEKALKQTEYRKQIAA